MKREEVEYVAKYLECQPVKVVHQYLVEILKLIPIPEWKWETITMDFIIGLPKTKQNRTTQSWLW